MLWFLTGSWSRWRMLWERHRQRYLPVLHRHFPHPVLPSYGRVGELLREGCVEPLYILLHVPSVFVRQSRGFGDGLIDFSLGVHECSKEAGGVELKDDVGGKLLELLIRVEVPGVVKVVPGKELPDESVGCPVTRRPLP